MHDTMSATPASANRQHGYFYPHGMWAPGVKLMRQLNFGWKAILISLLFAAPIALLGQLLASAQMEEIRFSEKERTGLNAFTQVLPLYKGFLTARNAARAGLGGIDRSSQYSQARAQTDQALAAFESHINSSEDAFGLAADLATFKGAWQASGVLTNLADQTLWEQFEITSTQLSKLLFQIGDASNLALDPSIDSAYLVNTLVMTMPQTGEDLAQLWGWGTYAIAKDQLAQKEMSKRETNIYGVWAAGANNGLRQSRSALERVLKANPAMASLLNMATWDDAEKYLTKVKDPDKILADGAWTPTAYYETGEAALGKFFSFYDKALPALDKLLDERVARMKQRMLLGSLLVLAVVWLAIYYFYSFYLVTKGGLQLMQSHLQEIAAGDLRRIPAMPWGKDEPATLILDLRLAYDALRHLIQNVQTSADHLHHASDEIATASAELSGRTEDAAATLAQQAAAMAQVGETVSEMAARAQDAAIFARDNASVAAHGGQVINDVVQTMQEIHTSSSRIGDITGVIDGIAFQTNILALNAAVEAARAGEAGRGFAVVASEVRSLAHRSAEAAREIRSLITASVNKVAAGTVVVEQAGNAIRDVVDNAKQIDSFLAEIAGNATKQAATVEQIGDSIQQLDRSTQQNAALVEETSSAARTLRQEANTLQDEVGNFVLAD